MAQPACLTPRLSCPFKGKPILLGFDAADMRSDAGLAVLREIKCKAVWHSGSEIARAIRRIPRKFGIACATSSGSGPG